MCCSPHRFAVRAATHYHTWAWQTLIYGKECFILLLILCIHLLLCVHSSFAIIFKRKRKLFALLLLSYRYIVNINVRWLFLTVPLVGLQYLIVVIPDHTHFFQLRNKRQKSPSFSSYNVNACRFRLTRKLTNKKQLPHNKRFFL